jgi:hypothetical protein
MRRNLCAHDAGAEYRCLAHYKTLITQFHLLLDSVMEENMFVSVAAERVQA